MSPPLPSTSVADDEVLRSDQYVQTWSRGKFHFVDAFGQWWLCLPSHGERRGFRVTGVSWHNWPVNLEMSNQRLIALTRAKVLLCLSTPQIPNPVYSHQWQGRQMLSSYVGWLASRWHLHLHDLRVAKISLWIRVPRLPCTGADTVPFLSFGVRPKGSYGWFSSCSLCLGQP